MVYPDVEELGFTVLAKAAKESGLTVRLVVIPKIVFLEWEKAKKPEGMRH